MKQEEKEQQLREAAEKQIVAIEDWIKNEPVLMSIFIDEIILAYKSEAAKAYHQQTESVNLDELRNEFYSLVDTGKMEYYKIFNFFLPYLKPKEQKQSDTVEFATYLSINNWESSNGIMYNKFRNEYGSKYIITTEHIDNIYHQFLTSKTK